MDKSRKRGQALIEFVLLLPIIIFIILGVIDVGRILYTRTHLEGKMNDVVNMVNKGIYDTSELEENINHDKDKIVVKLKNNEQEIEIILVSDISFITPGFNLILNDPYDIKVKRIIANE